MSGMALHPLDGLAQGAPHTIALFLVPTHLTTHLTISFFGAIWTANIHDCIDEKLWPIMGGGYHMIHHLSNHHNYGLYTIWMDWMFGTLSHPMSDGTKPNWGTCPAFSLACEFLLPIFPSCLSTFVVRIDMLSWYTLWLVYKNCGVV